MWALMLGRLASSKLLRWVVFIVLALLAGWLVMCRMNAQAARIAELQSSLEAVKESEDAQRRFSEALAKTPRDRDALFERLRRGEG